MIYLERYTFKTIISHLMYFSKKLSTFWKIFGFPCMAFLSYDTRLNLKQAIYLALFAYTFTLFHVERVNMTQIQENTFYKEMKMMNVKFFSEIIWK